MTHDVGLGALAAVVRRGEGIEAWHAASVAVVDATCKVVAAFGVPDLILFARSAIKPFQATPLVTSGAAAALGVTSEELALACASHSGTDEHVRVAKSLLARSGAASSDLKCGAHLPIEYRLQGRSACAGEDQDPLRNACSGKHAGFLALARHLDEPFSEYLSSSSRTQQRVKSALATICEVPEASLLSGIDGCSAPNFALPLLAMARGMLKLAHADPSSSELSSALSRIRGAMLAHPLLVSGSKRFDYDLMRAFPGNIVSKGGAEALQIMGFCDPPLGIAIKVHDGSARALAPICVSVLSQLGLIGSELPESLRRHQRPRVENHRGIITGDVEATLQLSVEPTLL